MVPKLHIQKTWNSDIKITWDEIPLDQRNGKIQDYTVFYWNQNGPVNGKLNTLSLLCCMGYFMYLIPSNV